MPNPTKTVPVEPSALHGILEGPGVYAGTRKRSVITALESAILPTYFPAWVTRDGVLRHQLIESLDDFCNGWLLTDPFFVTDTESATADLADRIGAAATWCHTIDEAVREGDVGQVTTLVLTAGRPEDDNRPLLDAALAETAAGTGRGYDGGRIPFLYGMEPLAAVTDHAPQAAMVREVFAGFDAEQLSSVTRVFQPLDPWDEPDSRLCALDRLVSALTDLARACIGPSPEAESESEAITEVASAMTRPPQNPPPPNAGGLATLSVAWIARNMSRSESLRMIADLRHALSGTWAKKIPEHVERSLAEPT